MHPHVTGTCAVATLLQLADQRQVSSEEGAAFARRHGCLFKGARRAGGLRPRAPSACMPAAPLMAACPASATRCRPAAAWQLLAMAGAPACLPGSVCLLACQTVLACLPALQCWPACLRAEASAAQIGPAQGAEDAHDALVWGLLVCVAGAQALRPCVCVCVWPVCPVWVACLGARCQGALRCAALTPLLTKSCARLQRTSGC